MRKLHSTGGFWLLVGILLLGGSPPLLWGTLLAVLVHELGHGMAILLLGGKVECIRLTATGVEMRPQRDRIFFYGEDCFIALAGPTASFLLAFLVSAAAGEWDFLCLLSGISFLLGAVNLLPIGNLDGGRIFRGMLSHRADPHALRRWSQRITALLSTVLMGVGGAVWQKTGNVTLCLLAFWLLSDPIE